MAEKIGPVLLVAIGFPPDANFEGRVMDEKPRRIRSSESESPAVAKRARSQGG